MGLDELSALSYASLGHIRQRVHFTPRMLERLPTIPASQSASATFSVAAQVSAASVP